MLRLILSLFFCVFLSAADVQTVPKSKTIEGNHFVRGKTVEISGVINGDLYVFGGQVFIDGTVNGNVLVAGGTVQMEGQVKENIRLAAGQATISGTVGGNVTALSGTVEVQPSAVIDGSLVGLAGNIDLAGAVHGQVYVGTSNLRLSNGIQGDVTAYVNNMRITSKAQIEGQLEYWSNTKASIDPAAKILGGTVHHPSFFYSITEGKVVKSLRLGTKLLPLLMNFLYTLALGIILIRYFPKGIEQGLKAIKKNPIHTVLTGIVILVLLPLVSLLFLMSVLGAPFAITLIAVNVFAFYTAKIFTIIWVQTLIFRKRFEKYKKLYFTLGLIVYFIVTMIPHVGDIIAFAAMLLGLGAMVRGRIIALEKN